MARKNLLFGSAIKSAVAPWDVDSDLGWTSLTGGDISRGVDLYFKYVPWLFRAVKDRAANVAALPWAIERGDTEIANSAEWSDDKPVEMEWLDNPRRMFSQIEQSLAITSRAYLFLETNPYGYIKSAQYCTPSTITEIYDKTTGALVSYDRTVNGKKTNYPVEKIVAIYDSDYITEIGPAKSSPALAALMASGVLFSTDQFVEHFFSRGAIKASVMSIESGSQAEHERLAAWWEDVIAGVKNAWAAIVVRGKVNAPVVIGEGIEGLENDSLTSSKRQDIATALGIPESRLWSAAANYATRNEDEKAYYRGTIIPEFDLIAEAFNSQIFTAAHKLDGWRIESQPENLDIFQEDEADRAGSLKSLTDAGIPLITAMELLGYDLTDEQWAAIKEASKPEPIPPALAPFAGTQPALPAPAVEQEKPEPEDPMPPKSITPEVLKELDIWRWKWCKAMKNGSGPDVEFIVHHIDEHDADLIRAALAECKTIEEGKAVFSDWQSGPVDPWLAEARRLNKNLEALDYNDYKGGPGSGRYPLGSGGNGVDRGPDTGGGGGGEGGDSVGTATTKQAMEIIQMQAYGAPPEHIEKYLRDHGINHVDAYHVTSIESVDKIKKEGIRTSSQSGREDASYFFLDKGDVSRNANNLGRGHGGTQYAIVTIRIPRSDAAYIQDDGLYNGSFSSSYSAARLKRGIPSSWIHRTETSK